MALLRALGALIVGMMLFAGEVRAAPSEYQVKAVFLFNFSQFVEWPPSAIAERDAPFVIGVFGHDPFGNSLDEAARGETVDGRPLVVRQVRSAAEAGDCQILFIHKSEEAKLDDVLAALAHRSTLTVSDVDGSAQHGAMIRLITDKSRIRLRIDVEAARAAGLVISSKLLRSAEIVSATDGGD